MNETGGQRVPVDYFRVDIDKFPRPQRIICEILERAAALGGELYLEQRNNLKPYQHQLDELAKQDPLAQDPHTIPDRDGKFIPLWEHPTQVPVLKEVRQLQLRAARAAGQAGLASLGKYLALSSMDLTQGDYDGIKSRYIRLVGSPINYHLLPIESEVGFGNKQFWQGFLGLTDLADSQNLQIEVRELREAGAATLGGSWYTPLTNVTIDRVAVMSGWISLLAQGQRRQEKGLPAEGGLSAQNFPNEVKLTRAAGSRIIIYAESFMEVCQAIDDIGRDYLDPTLVPTSVDDARFLVSHELAHDERYDNHLGWLHSAIREAYANYRAIVAAAETWGEQSELFKSIVKGALGYALRDSHPYLKMGVMPNLATLVGKSSHVPGSLGLLHSGIQQEALILESGLIVTIDWEKSAALFWELAHKGRELLQTGTDKNAAKHLEDILPKGPLSFGGKDGDRSRPEVFPRPRLPRWPWFNSGSRSASTAS